MTIYCEVLDPSVAWCRSVTLSLTLSACLTVLTERAYMYLWTGWVVHPSRQVKGVCSFFQPEVSLFFCESHPELLYVTDWSPKEAAKRKSCKDGSIDGSWKRWWLCVAGANGRKQKLTP
mmetsp:Transcript_48002/g.94781  ORF Transcript_48002/g.94781 Transcript_48002/m.94781 type:complete len:119 (+) Transcript_48002:1879-2235(+)